MDNQDDLKYLLNKYQIDKNKYIDYNTNIYFYNRDNVIQNDNILDLICPICYYILKNPKFCSLNKNSHEFCKECIDKYLEENNKCPICKNNFENKNKMNLKINFINLILNVYFLKKDVIKL